MERLLARACEAARLGYGEAAREVGEDFQADRARRIYAFHRAEGAADYLAQACRLAGVPELVEALLGRDLRHRTKSAEAIRGGLLAEPGAELERMRRRARELVEEERER